MWNTKAYAGAACTQTNINTVKDIKPVVTESEEILPEIKALDALIFTRIQIKD